MMIITPATFGQLPAVRITAPDGAQATVTLYGAHLVSWKSAGGEEHLFCSAKSALDGKPKFVNHGAITPDGYAVNTMAPPFQPSRNAGRAEANAASA